MYRHVWSKMKIGFNISAVSQIFFRVDHVWRLLCRI